VGQAAAAEVAKADYHHDVQSLARLRAHRAACVTKLPHRKEPRWCTQGSIALSLYTTTLTLHTIFAHIFGASISETKIRPNPRYTLEAEAGGGGVVRSHCCITARPLYTTECNAADVACACYLGRHVCASSSWRTCDTLCVLIRPTVPRDSAPPLLRRRRGRPPGGGLGEDELEVEVTAAALAAPCSSYCVVKLLWPDKDAPQVRVGAAAGERDRQVGRRCGQAEAEHSETARGRQA
jgi:hypothetical protein